MHIDICICTFRRASITDALKSLDQQIVPEGTTLAIIVADNDETPSAQETVLATAATMTLPVTYIHAPARNISIARNAGLEASQGQWVAFFDDDERAPVNWIEELCAAVRAGGYDAVFGPAIAEYPSDTPNWIKRRDYHSNWPEARNGEVQTGHTCNALVNMAAAPFAGQRFLLEKGKTGGEDTEFFFRAWRAGAKLGIAEEAVVFEPAEPARMSFAWIRRRKYRSGISYGRHAVAAGSRIGRVKVVTLAAAKCVFSALIALLCLPFATPRNYWLLRAVFHAGVCASVTEVREQELYG